jgi:hypothetical protein
MPEFSPEQIATLVGEFDSSFYDQGGIQDVYKWWKTSGLNKLSENAEYQELLRYSDQKQLPVYFNPYLVDQFVYPPATGGVSYGASYLLNSKDPRFDALATAAVCFGKEIYNTTQDVSTQQKINLAAAAANGLINYYKNGNRYLALLQAALVLGGKIGTQTANERLWIALDGAEKDKLEKQFAKQADEFTEERFDQEVGNLRYLYTRDMSKLSNLTLFEFLRPYFERPIEGPLSSREYIMREKWMQLMKGEYSPFKQPQ